MRSPVWPQPEPRTRATSWRSTPVRSRMTAAAASATANGSVAGSDRSWAAAVSVTAAQRIEAGGDPATPGSATSCDVGAVSAADAARNRR